MNTALIESKLARLGEFVRESPQLQQTQKFITVEQEASSNIESKTLAGDEGFKPGPKKSSPLKRKAKGEGEAAGKEKKVVKQGPRDIQAHGTRAGKGTASRTE